MLTRAVLQLIDDVLGQPEGGSGRIEVLPCLVDDLALHANLLRQAVEHAGGIYLEADVAADGVRGQLDGALTGPIGEAIRLPRPGGEVTPSFRSDDDGTIHVGLEGQAEEVDDPGIRTVRGVATALLDARIRTARLAVLAYNEAPLDVDARTAVWSLITEHIPRLPLGELRRLVVLLGVEETDYRRHCTGEVSARYRLTGTDWSRRPSVAISRTLVPGTAPGEGPTVLFLGAGFSVSSRLPLGDALRNVALRNLLGSEGEEDANRLATMFHERLADSSRLLFEEHEQSLADFTQGLTLERVLREERRWYEPEEMPTLRFFRQRNDEAFETIGKAISEVKSLLERPRDSWRPIIVTVNFDTLLEHVASDALRVFANDEQFDACEAYLNEYVANGGPVPMLKLHGSIEEPGSVVANVDETVGGLTDTRQKCLRTIARAAEKVPWTYIGYSMRDLDIVPLLREEPFAQSLEEHWVSPFPDRNVVSFVEQYRTGIWRRSRRAELAERTIGLTADDFAEALGGVRA